MTPTHQLTCDDCGCLPRKPPAIDLAGRVFCVRCALRHGLFPGEYNSDVRSYEEWQEVAHARRDLA